MDGLGNVKIIVELIYKYNKILIMNKFIIIDTQTKNKNIFDQMKFLIYI